MSDAEIELVHSALEGFPVVIDLPVVWGEMDAFGHVNNTVYFKYFESARIDFFEHMPSMSIGQDGEIGPILAETQCRFRIPLTYPDRVWVGAAIDRWEKGLMWMKYCVVSQQHKAVAALGEGRIVAYDYANSKKVDLPKGWCANIKKMQPSLPDLQD